MLYVLFILFKTAMLVTSAFRIASKKTPYTLIFITAYLGAKIYLPKKCFQPNEVASPAIADSFP